MIEGIPILNTIGALLFFVAKIIVLITSGIAVYKNKNIASILMLTGAIAILIADVLGIALIYYAGSTGPTEVVKFTGINSIISAISYLLFAFGFLYYILSSSKPPSQSGTKP